jgi:hypothetical protein
MTYSPHPTPRADREELSLNDAASHLLEECRTVIPGMQALFGFQLIAVFNQSFATRLSPGEQAAHIIAIALVAASIAMLMAPAVLHRHTEPMAVSRRFLEVSSRLLMWSMVPLVAGMGIDIYLVARLGFGSQPSAMILTAIVLAVFVLLWVVLPQSRPLQDALGARTTDQEDPS